MPRSSRCLMATARSAGVARRGVSGLLHGTSLLRKSRAPELSLLVFAEVAKIAVERIWPRSFV